MSPSVRRLSPPVLPWLHAAAVAGVPAVGDRRRCSNGHRCVGSYPSTGGGLPPRAGRGPPHRDDRLGETPASVAGLAFKPAPPAPAAARLGAAESTSSRASPLPPTRDAAAGAENVGEDCGLFLLFMRPVLLCRHGPLLVTRIVCSYFRARLDGGTRACLRQKTEAESFLIG